MNSPPPNESTPHPQPVLLGEVDKFQVVSTLTTVLLLFHAPSTWYLRTPMMILCIVGLVSRSLYQRSWYWFLLGVLVLSTTIQHWYSSDNHKYLIGYLCLALAGSTLAKDIVQRNEMLATNARWLLFLCMAFATAWKLMSPTYLDSSFFHFTLLTDDRFAYVARWVGMAEADELLDNEELEDELTDKYTRRRDTSSVQLHTNDTIRLLAQVFTWWTVLIEGVVAVSFLLPTRRWSVYLRQSLLLLFAVTTYSVATVKGFGWTLMILGLAQCPDDMKRFRAAFLVVFCVIEFYTFPYAELAEVFLAETP